MTETELLFTEVLGCDRLSLYLNKGLTLGRSKSFLISSVLKKRMQGEPLPYILGKAEFMGLEFKVTPDVLIPRAETEILVETTMRLVSCVMCHVSCVKILDMGTGSGCIAVALAKFFPGAKITAVDISTQSLEVARYNARINNVDINFLQGELFSTYGLPLTAYDCIISNPPYIPTDEIEKLQSEIQYEPRIALDGGRDGLDFYRRIIKVAPDYLTKGALLIMEMGFGQAAQVKNIFNISGKFKIIDIAQDYNNIDRVIIAERH